MVILEIYYQEFRVVKRVGMRYIGTNSRFPDAITQGGKGFSGAQLNQVCQRSEKTWVRQ